MKSTKANEIRLIRTYKAPLKAVWDAWADEKQAAQWWGPRGFTITTHRKDLHSGGGWDYTMHGPDGVDYPNKTKYLEVDPHKKLVYDHGGNDDRPPLFRVTVFFEERGENTEMDMTMAFPTAEAATEIKAFIKKAGGDATWDRLAEYLEKRASGKEIFVINRSFETPILNMFEMWSNPKHLEKWVPPTGFEMRYISADIKPDGKSFYEMSNGSNITMYGKAHYLEIEKPNHLLYTQVFCDKEGKISRHPMAPTWPETMLTTVTLSEEGSHETRVTIEWEVHGKATPEEIQTFINGRAGMTMGWTGSFDKLENYLKINR